MEPVVQTNKPGHRGIKRLGYATLFSWRGFVAAWRNEAAFRQIISWLVFAIGIAIFMDLSLIQRLMLVGSVLLVLMAELLNSAVEAIVDKTSPELHPLAGRAKDMGSAAVLVAMTIAAMVWVGVFLG
jgi:diacylglycerol kinase (ATP)